MTNSPDHQSYAPSGQPPSPPPAGWYPDPHTPGRTRWWDGAQWSEYLADTGSGAPAAINVAPKRRTTGARIAIIILSVFGGLFALAIFAAIALNAARDVLNDSDQAEPLAAEVPSAWVTTPVLHGAGTLSYDPQWEDAMDLVSALGIDEAMAVDDDFDAIVDGAWMISGDHEYGGTVLMVISVADAPGQSRPSFEVQSFIDGATDGLDDFTTTRQGAVRTVTGLSGYTAEFEYPLYDDVILNSVGVVVDGNQQVLVTTVGSHATGAGTEQMETVLNSLQLD